MINYFTPMNDAYRNKLYPNGFIEGATKPTKRYGNILCVVAVILLVIFIPLAIFGTKSAINKISNLDIYNIDTALIFIAIGLAFDILAIFCFIYGLTLKRKASKKLICEWAKKNNYTEKVIQDYINQTLNDDTYIMHTEGEFDAKHNVGDGLLTKDFLALDDAIIKLEDIVGIYLVDTVDIEEAGNKDTYVSVLKIAVCAKNRSIMCPVKEDVGNKLIEMLKSRNLNIDTKQEHIVAEKVFVDFDNN